VKPDVDACCALSAFIITSARAERAGARDILIVIPAQAGIQYTQPAAVARNAGAYWIPRVRGE
jgi:hypothetical protein